MMGISVGCQGLSRFIDALLADLKDRCVFNFLYEPVVNPPSSEEHVAHVREVLGRLQSAGFTLNPHKVIFCATEIKYLGRLLSSRGIRILPDSFRYSEIPTSDQLEGLEEVHRYGGI
jgi:hypothetical protein